ncbi:MAG: aminoacyl-tRNA hydrolase [Candidatus Pacebacteria bacterium]|jgi:PTH1 family peptidyl-tRNA hydrolase|nr:aminoacyl-tRNA hydrolase [Candidatus Paceibacterota bacterium]
MFYIVGLGNPGAKYEKTRHNAGWWVLDACVADWELSQPVLRKRVDGRVTDGLVLGEEVTLLYPETFMNSSGSAVAKLVPKDALSSLILIYDDVDVPVGKIKISFGNGAGGHNGVASVIERLGTKDFIRVRIGVSPQNEAGVVVRPSSEDLAAYVLAKVPAAEMKQYKDVLTLAIEAIEMIMAEGKERAMNRYN